MDITVHFAARAIQAVRAAAASEILPRYRKVVARRKVDGSLVTEADFAMQLALERNLCAVARAPVLGEEMDEQAQRSIWNRGGRFWCVDPIDGTTNFNAGVPYFAVSVALIEGTRPLFGIVYNPIADEAFFAVRGAGAWLNSERLERPGRPVALASAVAEIDLRREQARLRQVLKAQPPFAKRHTSGSSALSWCHLACGRVDLFVHAGQKVWDYAAGALVLEEARGHLCTLENDDFWQAPVWTRSVIAARTPALFANWRDWVRQHL